MDGLLDLSCGRPDLGSATVSGPGRGCESRHNRAGFPQAGIRVSGAKPLLRGASGRLAGGDAECFNAVTKRNYILMTGANAAMAGWTQPGRRRGQRADYRLAGLHDAGVNATGRTRREPRIATAIATSRRLETAPHDARIVCRVNRVGARAGGFQTIGTGRRVAGERTNHADV